MEDTIIPALLQEKLGVPDYTCMHILTDRKQHVRLGEHITDSRSISTGADQ